MPLNDSYFKELKTEILCEELSYTIDNNIISLNEVDAPSSGDLWNNITGLYHSLNSKIANSGIFSTIKGFIFGDGANGTGLSERLKQLGNWFNNSSVQNWTTAGLCGAGLLGAWYLWKKHKEKKLEEKDLLYAAKLDRLKANQLPPNLANKPVNIQNSTNNMNMA